MKYYSTKSRSISSLRNFILLFMTLSIYSCSGGYKVEGDNVYYVEWNEAQGKVMGEK